MLGAPRDASWGPNVWVEPAGHAAAEPELVRDLYAAAAERWVAEGRTSHYAVVPATDPALVDAWFRVGFGHQHVHAIREPWPADAVVEVPPELTLRAPTRDDIDALARIDVALPAHQARSPVFSLLPLPSVEEARAEYEADFDDPRFATFVVEHEGEVIGAAVGCPIEVSSGHKSLTLPPGAGFLGFAAVLPEHRGLGAGRVLGDAVLAWSRERGPSERRHRLAHDEPPRVPHVAAARLPPDVLPALPRDRLGRVRAADADPQGVPVRREAAVALEHPRRDEELDVAPDVGRALDDVRRRLREAPDEREGGLPRGRGGRGRDGIDLEHGVDDLHTLEPPAALLADAPHVRQQVQVGLLGHPVGDEHGVAQAIEVGDRRLRGRDAPPALVDVPAGSHLVKGTSGTRRVDRRRSSAPTRRRWIVGKTPPGGLTVRSENVLRVPLHSGSRLPLVTLPDETVLLAAAPPLDPLADVPAAVAEALRYPLAGPSLADVATRGGRATVVLQTPTLPLPTVEEDPRRDALAAVLDALTEAGVARGHAARDRGPRPQARPARARGASPS